VRTTKGLLLLGTLVLVDGTAHLMDTVVEDLMRVDFTVTGLEHLPLKADTKCSGSRG
jgi:hypothetical protein